MSSTWLPPVLPCKGDRMAIGRCLGIRGVHVAKRWTPPGLGLGADRPRLVWPSHRVIPHVS